VFTVVASTTGIPEHAPSTLRRSVADEKEQIQATDWGMTFGFPPRLRYR